MKKGWEYKKLGEIGTFQRGKGIRKTDFTERGKPCIHYGQLHTEFGVATTKHLREVSCSVFDKSPKAHKGDLLFALTSEDVEGSCKATAWLGEYDVAVSSDAAIYSHSIDSVFVSYFFQSKMCYLQKARYAQGFKVTHIKPSEVATFTIPVPPISEQQSIVAELDKINEIIDLKKAQLKDLDLLAQSIFYDMFGDPIENPKGWEVSTYGEQFKLGAGGTPSKTKPEYWENGDIPWIGSNMCQNSIVYETDGKYITKEGLSHSSAKMLDEGTVLVALVGATIGKTALLRTKTSTNQNIAFVDVNGNLIFDSYFVFYHLQSLYELFLNIGNGEFKMASQGFIKTLPIILPPLPLQQSFASKIQAIESQKSAIKQSLAEVETLLASRMDYYFN